MSRELRHAYLALWAATALGAALATVGVNLVAMRAPHDPLAASAGTVAQLVAHNAPVALWPLALIALSWPAVPGARVAGDVVIAGQLLGQGVLVGGVLGQRPGAWRYLPHLPLEWLALAVPAAAWLQARRGAPVRPGRLVGSVARVLGLLALAAMGETYLVPLP